MYCSATKFKLGKFNVMRHKSSFCAWVRSAVCTVGDLSVEIHYGVFLNPNLIFYNLSEGVWCSVLYLVL